MKKIVLLIIVSFALYAPTTALGQNSEIVEKANYAFKAGKYADAENLYNTAADYASGDDVNLIRLKAKNAARAAALQKEAEKAWNLGDRITAMQKYEDLLKLNLDDQTAISRVNEMEQAKQLEKAMYWYNKKDYAQALALFNNAGPSTMWNSQQKNAYKRCQMEGDYNNWRNSTSEALAETRAVRFITDYPNSIYDKEVRESLFNYYMKNKQFEKASNYAVTAEQKRQLAMVRQANNSSSQRKQPAGTASEEGLSAQKMWAPTFGLATELSLLGSLIDGLDEAALPVELRLLNQNSVLNVSLGARLGIREMFLPDTLRYAEENSSYVQQIEASYSYCQFSPFINVKLHLGKDDISSGAFFLGFTGRMNYNFNYTFYKTESVQNQYGAQYSNENKYHSKDLLTPITSTVVGELGYGSESIEFYIYFSYDIANSIDYSKVMQLRNNPENPHSQMLSQSSFVDRYTKDTFVGAGLRVYFGD